MVKICQTGLLKLYFETSPKKRIFRFLPKISAGHGWSWKFFFANFQILGPLGCQGWVVIPQNVKKSQNHCTLMYISFFGLSYAPAAVDVRKRGNLRCGGHKFSILRSFSLLRLFLIDRHRLRNKHQAIPLKQDQDDRTKNDMTGPRMKRRKWEPREGGDWRLQPMKRQAYVYEEHTYRTQKSITWHEAWKQEIDKTA